ncbi:MAG TPA: carboxypeptidase regulatory-like domain-containing protein [bacterium]|jgi:hypothetical protein
MRQTLRIALSLLTVLILAVAAWAQPGIVMGTVTDTTGVGIDSAYVTLSRCCGGGGGGGGIMYSTYTGEDGAYIFPAVTPNSYKIKATKSGYGMAMQNITVVAGETLVVDLVLSGGCGGCQGDTLEVVEVAGYAMVDSGMCQNMYFLDTDSNGVADYHLNFGPPWYEPGSGAERPEDGEWCEIVGGLVENPDPDMIIVYEINGLWWRDPVTMTQLRRRHLAGRADGLTISRPLINSFSPNPFNPQTAVNFTLPEAGFVNLAVYDLQGRKVADLLNGSLDAGAHQAIWNADGLSSGVYLFRLKAGDAVSIKRAVFAK